MEVLDIFSWLPAKEMSLEQLEKIFEEYFNGTYRGEYTISIETPCNIGKNILLIGVRGQNLQWVRPYI